MKLTGPQGDFELNVLDYEYSDSADFLDRNWLIVSMVTKEGEQQSTRTLTFLSTWELELLHDWMQSVIDNAELAPKLTFIEPSLSFCNLSDGKEHYVFRISMTKEATPKWHDDETKPYWLPVTPDKDELKQAIHDLARQLNKFPVRA
ncbi:WapI family immunity protein [Fibrella forsythiae]|uniref:Uncharacterized protein n=1 Tax=Fibrella forsythiae TaxID=2817061 RepID=A0ABS3JFN6_9BACT|nr:hypothetical protein [Fibrella forsythiae]MBO0948785.1 hypothetical protein [Fibrella forsythiae]